MCFCWSGMGVTTITAARILKGQLQNRTGEETVMNMDTFPYVGLAKVTTHTKHVMTPHIIVFLSNLCCYENSTPVHYVSQIMWENKNRYLMS